MDPKKKAENKKKSSRKPLKKKDVSDSGLVSTRPLSNGVEEVKGSVLKAVIPVEEVAARILDEQFDGVPIPCELHASTQHLPVSHQHNQAPQDQKHSGVAVVKGKGKVLDAIDQVVAPSLLPAALQQLTTLVETSKPSPPPQLAPLGLPFSSGEAAVAKLSTTHRQVDTAREQLLRLCPLLQEANTTWRELSMNLTHVAGTSHPGGALEPGEESGRLWVEAMAGMMDIWTDLKGELESVAESLRTVSTDLMEAESQEAVGEVALLHHVPAGAGYQQEPRGQSRTVPNEVEVEHKAAPDVAGGVTKSSPTMSAVAEKHLSEDLKRVQALADTYLAEKNHLEGEMSRLQKLVADMEEKLIAREENSKKLMEEASVQVEQKWQAQWEEKLEAAKKSMSEQEEGRLEALEKKLRAEAEEKLRMKEQEVRAEESRRVELLRQNLELEVAEDVRALREELSMEYGKKLAALEEKLRLADDEKLRWQQRARESGAGRPFGEGLVAEIPGVDPLTMVMHSVKLNIKMLDKMNSLVEYVMDSRLPVPQKLEMAQRINEMVVLTREPTPAADIAALSEAQ